MQPESLSDQVFHTLLSLLRCSRKYAHLMMDKSGLTPREFSVLRYLLEQNSATVGQIQAFLQISPSTTSTLISKLEDKGYLTRIRSVDDHRVVIVSLTPTGCDLANNTPIGGLPLVRRELGHLSIQRLQEMESVLKEILQLMQVTEDK